jgi:hypothetical protein
MNDLEEMRAELRRTLERKGDELGPPPPLRPGLDREVRRHQLRRSAAAAGWAVLVLVALGLVVRELVPGGAVGPAAPTIAPQRIYVLEVAGDLRAFDISPGGHATQVWRARPDGGGWYEDVVASPDGARLFAVGVGGLVVLDASSGAVQAEATFGEWAWRGVMLTGLNPTMAVSPDGSRVFVRVLPAGGEVVLDEAIATFDVGSGRFLQEAASVTGCLPGDPVLPLGPSSLALVCTSDGNEIRFLELSSTGGVSSEERLELPSSTAGVEIPHLAEPLDLGPVAGAVSWPERGEILAVTREGEVFVVDVATRTLEARVRLDLPGFRVAWPARVARVGEELVLGLQPVDFTGADRATHLAVVDPSSFEVRAVSPADAWAFAPGIGGGPWLFLLDAPREGGLGVGVAALDPMSGDRVEVLPRTSLGGTKLGIVLAGPRP